MKKVVISSPCPCFPVSVSAVVIFAANRRTKAAQRNRHESDFAAGNAVFRRFRGFVVLRYRHRGLPVSCAVELDPRVICARARSFRGLLENALKKKKLKIAIRVHMFYFVFAHRLACAGIGCDAGWF